MAYWDKPSFAGTEIAIDKRTDIAYIDTLLTKTSSITNYLDYQLGCVKNYLLSAKSDLNKNNMSVDDKSFEPYFDKLIKDLEQAEEKIDQAIKNLEKNAQEFADKTELSFKNYKQYLIDKAREDHEREQANIQHHYDYGNIG